MDRLLGYAFLASIAAHVAVVTVLRPRGPALDPLPIIVASLREPLAASQELSPAASEPRMRQAAPTEATSRPTPRRTVAVRAVAERSPISVPTTANVPPETTPAAQAPVVVAFGAAQTTFEPPRFNVAYLANPPPPYPASARRRGIEGTVTIAARVGASGEAQELKLAASSGDATLDSAAMEAVRDWRFIPARRGEQAVDAWVRIPFVFRLN